MVYNFEFIVSLAIFVVRPVLCVLYQLLWCSILLLLRDPSQYTPHRTLLQWHNCNTNMLQQASLVLHSYLQAFSDFMVDSLKTQVFVRMLVISASIAMEYSLGVYVLICVLRSCSDRSVLL